MATKTYNTGRVVGWSAYEEFLKEHPEVDPTVITESIYYIAVSYGVTRIVEIPFNSWTTADIYLSTIEVPGAVWGVVPIVSPAYDQMNTMGPYPHAATYRDEIDNIFSNIYTCYVSNALQAKVTNATMEGGYLTFCAYPKPEASEHISTLKVIVRGLGVEALLDGNGYLGPEGMTVGAGGELDSKWADTIKMGYEEITLWGSEKAYRLKVDASDTEGGTSVERTFLSLRNCVTNHLYDFEGQQGVLSLQHTGSRMLQWQYLLYALVNEVAIDFTIPIKDVIDDYFLEELKKYAMQAFQAGTGIQLSQRTLSSKVIISNTMPYNITGEGYTRLHQTNFDLGHSSEWSYSVTPYNYFECYVESENSWLSASSIDSSLIGNKLIMPLRVRVLESEDTFTYNDTEYPRTISVIVEGVQNYTFAEDTSNTQYLFCVGKQSAWDSVTGMGFHYQGSTEPGFAFRHTDALDSDGYDSTLNRWLRGLKSQLFGIKFTGDYAYIGTLLSSGQYSFRSESGGVGIWNILKQASAGAAGSSFGASWEANGQLVLASQAGRSTSVVDIVATVASYADGYNRQLSEWSQQDGDDLLAHHLNMTFSGIFYHSS